MSPQPPAESIASRLLATRQAFDSVAADYDGPRGNNELIQDMRSETWRWLAATFASRSRLIDIGCGTGLDAVHMARSGHEVTAIDWSGRMVERTRERAEREGLSGQVHAVELGAHELQRLGAEGLYDGAYSNLGPLNCVPDLQQVARDCGRLIRPGGALLFTVMGRVCPWEIAHFLGRRRWDRVRVRFARGVVPVGLNARTVWTRYYQPREFYRPFAPGFILEHYRGLCVWAPPPYLVELRQRRAALYRRLWALDRRLAGWPLLRNLGDHFLMVLRRR